MGVTKGQTAGWPDSEERVMVQDYKEKAIRVENPQKT